MPPGLHQALCDRLGFTLHVGAGQGDDDEAWNIDDVVTDTRNSRAAKYGLKPALQIKSID
jgi:hypothetical protein